jgi:2-haloacid dehalogenase
MTDAQAPLSPDRYATISFDCYGTLIDWENGILGFMQPLLESYDVHVIDDWTLEFFAEHEPPEQARGGSYRSVLGRVLEHFGNRLAFTAGDREKKDFADSIEYWQPFEDTVPALRRLKEKYQLAVISNVDDDLFELTRRRLGIEFDHVISSEQVGAYKPAPEMFEAALDVVEGPLLHVAQSRYHDIAPALALNLDAVWIRRRGAGAARDAEVTPTWTFGNLQELADALC